MTNLQNMKVAELRELAKEQELSCYNRETKKAMTKAELVEMLEAHFVATTAPEAPEAANNKDMKTITTIKLEVRELGKGWVMIDYLDATKLDTLIADHNVQEYVIYEINEVTPELEHVKTLFKGVKYHHVKGNQLGSSEHDCDNTPCKYESITVNQHEDAVITKDNKVKPSFEKTSYFILLNNDLKEYHDDGYLAYIKDIPLVIHKSVNDRWSVTLQNSGKCISSNHSSRVVAYEKVKELIENVGYDNFKLRIVS